MGISALREECTHHGSKLTRTTTAVYKAHRVIQRARAVNGNLHLNLHCFWKPEQQLSTGLLPLRMEARNANMWPTSPPAGGTREVQLDDAPEVFILVSAECFRGLTLSDFHSIIPALQKAQQRVFQLEHRVPTPNTL